MKRWPRCSGFPIGKGNSLYVHSMRPSLLMIKIFILREASEGTRCLLRLHCLDELLPHERS